MEKQIEQYVDTIRKDYADWMMRGISKRDGDPVVAMNMIQRFHNGVTVKPGRKYIKVCNGSSVHSFIVATDNDKKFRKGDILKAAGYNAPARNAARGNILDDNYSVNWTGAEYLR